MIEERLARVCDEADGCGAEVSTLVSDTLVKITHDICAAPLRFAKILSDNPEAVRDVFVVLASALKRTPEAIASSAELKRALRKITKHCAKLGLDKRVEVLLLILVKEIARVFHELSTVLSRQRCPKKQRLLRQVGRYIGDVRQAMLCFAYNSIRLRVCVQALGQCGPESEPDEECMRQVLRNMRHLLFKSRTMAALAQEHRDVVAAALKVTLR